MTGPFPVRKSNDDCDDCDRVQNLVGWSVRRAVRLVGWLVGRSVCVREMDIVGGIVVQVKSIGAD